MIVLFAEFGIKNVGYHEPFSLIWWLGTLITVAASTVATAAILVFVLSQGIALGVNSDGSHSAGSAIDE